MQRWRCITTPFPLETFTQQQLQYLSKELWSWATCNEYACGRYCGSDRCSFRRMKRLACFFNHYKYLTASYEPSTPENPALKSHEDLLFIICQLKLNSHLSRMQLMKSVFHPKPNHPEPPQEDQNMAINLAVKVMVMINCSVPHQSWSLLEAGASQVPWRAEISFNDFMSEIFPLTDHPSLDVDPKSPLDIKGSLMARKFKKRFGLQFRSTDDIRKHLKFNRKDNTIELFHHTAFLKEHLRLTKDAPSNLTIEDSLKR